eukprot:TRINITY_DN18209_c0_g1_i1.p1 TRINITY_DN18209_c0_g1~~TRINITY_DN18209_c0_g1_i1.p1  ORF type:complete len:1118 (-),score=288.13 TRINITY_DN18209_c0_g1_i1:70-3423(-)
MSNSSSRGSSDIARHLHESEFHLSDYNWKLKRNKKKSKRKKGKEVDKGEIEMDEHVIDQSELFSRSGVDISKGLSEDQVAHQREQYGLNQLKPPKVTPWWLQLIKELFSGFNILLWIGAALCFVAAGITGTSDFSNIYLGAVLVIVIIFTALFSFYQRASSAAVVAGFLKMTPQTAVVLRNGIKSEIDARELVPGDIVDIKFGNKVPADLRLLESKGLKVDNASLTGESEPQPRSDEPTSENPLETRNLAFSGTNVTEGVGRGIVIKIGDETVIGHIAGLASGTSNEETPIHRDIHYFIKIIAVFAITMGVVLFLAGLAVYPILDNLIFAIGIIVANVPEALLATVTVQLTLTAKRLAKKNVLVKNLEAVETLGSTAVICSDKTGTLTQNIMTVTHVWTDDILSSVGDAISTAGSFDYSKPSNKAIVRVATLCNNAEYIIDTGKGEAGEHPDQALVDKKRKFFGIIPNPFYKAKDAKKKAGQRKKKQLRSSEKHVKKPLHSKKQISGAIDGVEVQNSNVRPQDRPARGDATEKALLHFTDPIVGGALEARQESTRIVEIPFSSTTKFQVSINKVSAGFVDEDTEGGTRKNGGKAGTALITLKGAPERVISRCGKIMINGEEVELTEEYKNKFQAAYDMLGGQGERVLGFAHLWLDPEEYDPETYEFDTEADTPNFPLGHNAEYTFIGLISLIDPPRPAVPKAVKLCQRAGIKVVMVTGDHPITAKAIAKQVNIIEAETLDEIAARLKKPVGEVSVKDTQAIVIHGAQLKEMTDAQLTEVLRVPQIVFARTSPTQKLRIVEGFQKLGYVVAVTGDGVNDSPALKKADIGVAMGKVGTDVAKDAADMILLDDNFASIVNGIREGRVIFDNLKKMIAYVMTANIPEIIPFVAFVILQVPLPLTTVLMMCISVGTDIAPAISIAYESAETDIMDRKPRDPRYDKLVGFRTIGWSYGQIGAFQAFAGMFVYFVVMSDYGFAPNDLFFAAQDWTDDGIKYTDQGAFDKDYRVAVLQLAQTAVFVSVMQVQWSCLLSCKTRKLSIFQKGMTNIQLTAALCFETVVAVLIVYLPGLGFVLGTRQLRFVHLFPALPFTLAILTYDETRKAMIRRWPNGWVARMTYY